MVEEKEVFMDARCPECKGITIDEVNENVFVCGECLHRWEVKKDDNLS